MNPVIQLKQINSGVKLQLSINLIELYSEQKSIQILHELLFFIVLYNSENTKQNNQNLPGMGGIFNHINSNLYHYAGNNPVKYVDPDGETISYTYDKGGQVTGVTGERNGVETVYVSKIGYDEYGQRSFIEYGNGVKTAYTYDENRRWLDSIETLSATQKLLQNMSYSFDRVGNVSGYTNDSGNYSTTQKYSYDSLYQLVGAKGKTEYKPNWPYDYEDHHGYVSNYEQSWRFDNIGNMKSKYSEMIDKPHNQHSSTDLNYSFEYTYDPNYAHRTISADNMFYTYDANGNIINERIDRQATKEELQHDVELAEGVYSLDYGIALPNQPDVETKPYSRSYIWNEKNQLKTSVENGFVVNYRYGEDGQRAVKSSTKGETLYFNNMWQMSTTPMGMRQTKHIFVGETRIATKNNWWKDSGTEYERYNTYYFHSDHLGSAQLITDWRGEEYERIEYTPYGELWIEKVRDGFETINYRFTGKEMDSETGLYYFGARYLDPKYSRWLSTDPALGDYVPQAPVNDEARKANGNLPGQGGLFNQVNFHLYHYAGNNPVRYIDPDGRDINDIESELLMSSANKDSRLGNELSNDYINEVGCVLTAYTRIANTIGNKNYTLEESNQKAVELKLYNSKNELTPKAGEQLINALLEGTGKSVTHAGTITSNSMTEYGSFLNSLEKSSSELFVTGVLDTFNQEGTKKYQHTVNINSNCIIGGDISDMDNAINIRVSDTSGVRSQVLNDVRSNKLLRLNYFRLN